MEDDIIEMLAKIKQNNNEGCVNFIIDNNTERNSFERELGLLDEQVFKNRENLILSLFIKRNGLIITDEELQFVSKLKNVKKIEIAGSNNKSYAPLKNMVGLTYFSTNHHKILDISFLEKLIRLKELVLCGEIVNIDCIGGCKNLEKMFLSISFKAEQLYFLTELAHLKELWIKTKKNEEFEKLKKCFCENGKEEIIKKCKG